jgi:hypothetical protein
MQFNESLLRYLMLECEEVPQTAYEPEAAFDINAIPSDDAPPAPPPEPVAEPVADLVNESTTEA